MAVSLKAFSEGLQAVDKVRRQRGWTKACNEWCETAQVTKASLNRFWLGRPIKLDSFIAICEAVGVDWREVAALQSPTEALAIDVSNVSSVNASSSISYVDIDWRKCCNNMFATQKRLTSNPLTVGDGLTFEFDEVFVPVGLVKREQIDRREKHISSELGSHLYQPKCQEEVKEIFHSEFFEQVLKQGNSAKSQGRRLAIIGEPGIGKTTLLQKIGDWVFKNTKEDIVIWVSLADLQGKSLEAYLLEDWLRATTKKVRSTEAMQESLLEQFNYNKVWLLLDGVDEMATNSTNQLVSLAKQLRGWIDQARIIVTCRLNVWDAGKNVLENFDVYRNLDFSYGNAQASDPQKSDQVENFIRHWFLNTPQLAKKLRDELERPGQERIKDMVKNPLRLALLCRTWQRRQGQFPNTRITLYQQFAEALYEWKQEIFPTASTERQELSEALGQLAKKAITQNLPQFRLSHRFVLEELGEPDAKNSLFYKALKLGWLNQVGVAAENPDEKVYAFFHPTFQEYFAVQSINDWQDLLKSNNYSLFFEPQWREIIQLWLEREDLSHSQHEAFINSLIQQIHASSDDDIHWQIAKYFGEISISNKNIINTLISLLKSQNEYTCCQAATSLGKIVPGNLDAINTLIELLRNSKDPWLCQQAAISLARIGSGNIEVIQALTSLLKTSQDEWIRQQYIKSILEQIGATNHDASEKLNNLLLSVKKYPKWGKERWLSLTELFNAIIESNLLSFQDKTSPDIYNEALQEVFLEISQKLHDEDYKQSDVIEWVNFLLNKHFTEITTEVEHKIGYSELSLLKNFPDLNSKYIWNHPETSFKDIVFKRLTGTTWKTLSETLHIPISTLTTFYQICVKHLNCKQSQE